MTETKSGVNTLENLLYHHLKVWDKKLNKSKTQYGTGVPKSSLLCSPDAAEPIAMYNVGSICLYDMGLRPITDQSISRPQKVTFLQFVQQQKRYTSILKKKASILFVHINRVTR